jgi:disulfide bond formation protein DsbB
MANSEFWACHMNHRMAGMLAVLGGLLALGLAYWAQYFELLVPCELCLWERWPYRIVIVLGLLAMLVRPATGRWVLGLAVAMLLVGVCIAGLHVGVELHWWPSPLPECNGILTPGAALPMIPARPCDAPIYLVPFIPVSMATMDMIYEACFALVLATYVARKPRRFMR